MNSWDEIYLTLMQNSLCQLSIKKKVVYINFLISKWDHSSINWLNFIGPNLEQRAFFSTIVYTHCHMVTTGYNKYPSKHYI